MHDTAKLQPKKVGLLSYKQQLFFIGATFLRRHLRLSRAYPPSMAISLYLYVALSFSIQQLCQLLHLPY